MKNHRSKKVKEICAFNLKSGCRDVCQLSGACKPHAFDTQEVFDARMNKAAEELTPETLKRQSGL